MTTAPNDLTATIDPALRKELSRLHAQEDAAGQGSKADRLFFQQRPHRNYRVRLSTPSEIREMDIMGGGPTLPANKFWWTAVRQVRPGCACAPCSASRPHARLIFSEERSRDFFERCTDGYTSEAYNGDET
jgi:hypothetical protein